MRFSYVFVTGIIENSPPPSIIGAKYYGYPIVWRVTATLHSDQFRFTDLAIDSAFWITISLLPLIILKKISMRSMKKSASPPRNVVSSSNMIQLLVLILLQSLIGTLRKRTIVV